MSWVVRIDGEHSDVFDTTANALKMGSHCEACHDAQGHAVEAAAHRCLATWFRKQAAYYQRLAQLSEREAADAAGPTALERKHGTGCVAARRNRVTRALRQLYRPGTQADGTDWMLVCEPHGCVRDVATRTMGESMMAEVEWCEGCQRALGVQGPPRPNKD